MSNQEFNDFSNFTGYTGYDGAEDYKSQDTSVADEHERKAAERAKASGSTSSSSVNSSVAAEHQRKVAERAVEAEHLKKSTERFNQHTEEGKVAVEHERKVKERSDIAHSKDVKGKSGGLKYGKSPYARHPLGVTITSSGHFVDFGATHRFFATVEDAPEEGVIWSCSEGRIDQKGHYTAPPISAVSARLPTGATITAVSRADTSQRAHFSIKFRTIESRDNTGPLGFVNSKGDTSLPNAPRPTSPRLVAKTLGHVDTTGYPDYNKPVSPTGYTGYSGHTGYTGYSGNTDDNTDATSGTYTLGEYNR